MPPKRVCENQCTRNGLCVFQVVRGNLLPEAVTWFFTSVLKALQVHGEHQVCHNTLTQLAMLIYENLVTLITAGVALIIVSSVASCFSSISCHVFSGWERIGQLCSVHAHLLCTVKTKLICTCTSHANSIDIFYLCKCCSALKPSVVCVL